MTERTQRPVTTGITAYEEYLFNARRTRHALCEDCLAGFFDVGKSAELIEPGLFTDRCCVCGTYTECRVYRTAREKREFDYCDMAWTTATRRIWSADESAPSPKNLIGPQADANHQSSPLPAALPAQPKEGSGR